MATAKRWLASHQAARTPSRGGERDVQIYTSGVASATMSAQATCVAGGGMTKARMPAVGASLPDLEVAVLAKEVRDLRRVVAALTELQRFQDVAVQRHALRPWISPTGARLDARDFVDSAEGIHFLEYSDTGAAYRWTGPGHFTRFRFQVSRKVPMLVRLNLFSRGQNSGSETLTIDVDGSVYILRPCGVPKELRAGPLPVRDGDGPTDVFLHVPTLFRPKERGEEDPRQLGVAVSGIVLEPAG